MNTRILGRTGLAISEISLGTVQLGMPYGLPDENGKLPHMSEAEALNILAAAYDKGVNFLDTARSYGDSEAIIARSLKKNTTEILIATKLVPLSEHMGDDDLEKTFKESLEASRRTLNRETLDLLQLHNATLGLLKREVLLDCFAEARHRDWIRFQGVTTYGVEAPQKALAQSFWDTLQIEFNLLNQSAATLFPLAQEKSVALIIRSAMLKGVFGTPREKLPESLRPLHDRIQGLPQELKCETASIAQLALLFVLSFPAVSTVLTGVLNTDQLAENLSVSEMPHLTPGQCEQSHDFHWEDPTLTDPRNW